MYAEVQSGTSILLDRATHVRFLEEPAGRFTKALGLGFDSTSIFGNQRSQQYALVGDDDKVKEASVEPDSTGVKGSVPSSSPSSTLFKYKYVRLF